MDDQKDRKSQDLISEVSSILDSYWLTNLANTSACIFSHLEDLNWVGFYLLRKGELVLGPFQGKVACLKIPLGKGVCGSAAKSRATIIVPDVHKFEGHIACDSASLSEIVVPLIYNDRLLGVLDIDSPQYNRFGAEDQICLEKLVSVLVKKTQWPESF